MAAEREPPPRPNRARVAPLPTDEDPTVRVWLRDTAGAGLPAQQPPSPVLPVPPPLPSASSPSNQTPSVALEIPTSDAHTFSQTLRRLIGGHYAGIVGERYARIVGERYAKIGAGLFVGGVLVGVVGAMTVMKSPPAPVVEATGLAALAVESPRPAALVAPKAPALEPANKRGVPIELKAENLAPADAPKPARESIEPPVSGSTAPSCRELLGKSLAERHDPKRALRETRLGNRALVRGDVAEAQAAFCKALFWNRKNIDRHINLGRLFLLRRDWAKAAEHGQSALEIDPDNRNALGLAGDAWAALNKTTQARQAWLLAERKPKATPSELRLIVRRNMALAKRVERLQDFSLAERFYRRVLLVEPEHAGAMRGIAGCLLRVGEKRAAEIWARRAETRNG
jgi:tetratricopeptide (TPR) repeat protein